MEIETVLKRIELAIDHLEKGEVVKVYRTLKDTRRDLRETRTLMRNYTVSQAARILNCSKSQIRYLLYTGQLRGFKIKKKNSKGSWRIYESALIEYIIENDNFTEILGVSDFSHLDEKVLIQKLRKKILHIATVNRQPSR
jgi:excisionase family DNA binding protein